MDGKSEGPPAPRMMTDAERLYDALDEIAWLKKRLKTIEKRLGIVPVPLPEWRRYVTEKAQGLMDEIDGEAD